MLYRILSVTEKLGQFRWSGFFSYQQTGTNPNGINYRHLSSDRIRYRYSIYLFQIESSGTFLTSHFSTMLYHIVSDTEKLGQFRWSGFFSSQQTERNQLSAFIFGPQLRRYSFYLFQIESSGTFLTSHFSTMLYHIV